MLDALDLDNWLVWRRLEHAVVSASTGVIRVYGPTKRFSPELSSLVNVGCAINQKGAKAGLMH